MPENIILYVVDRKSFRPIDHIENYTVFRYKQDAHHFGTAELEIDAINVNDAFLTALVEGRFGLLAQRRHLDDDNLERVDDFMGYAVKWRYEVGKEIETVYDYKPIVNEVILIGSPPESNPGALDLRPVYRYPASEYVPPSGIGHPVEEREVRSSAEIYGTKEKLFDARDISAEGDRDFFANSLLRKYAVPRITHSLTLGGVSAINRAKGKYYIELRDVFGYLDDRVVDTTNDESTGLISINDELPAVQFVERLMKRELFAPTDPDVATTFPLHFSDTNGAIKYRRTLDAVSLSILENTGTGDALGHPINRRFRWAKLSEAIRECCEWGDVNLFYQRGRNAAGRPIYQVGVRANNDRWGEGSDERVTVTEAWSARDFGVDVGDRIAFALRLSESEAVNTNLRVRVGLDGDAGPRGALCQSKEVTYRPDKAPQIRLSFYNDEVDMSRILESLNNRISHEESS